MPVHEEAENPPATREGPVFIAGRQHSGNTLMTSLIGRMAGAYVVLHEGVFFERHTEIDQLPETGQRARRVVEGLKVSETDKAAAHEHLTQWISSQSDPPAALPLYREAMHHLTERAGARFWGQKATSYIFSARHILEAMPEARIIYVIRNPYDMAASGKRRRVAAGKRGRKMVSPTGYVGMTLGWNRGADIFQKLLDQYPDRVLGVQYEHLVKDPEATVQRICAFLGEPYDPQLLDVQLINPAESKYSLTGVEGSSGFDVSRLYYYPSVLSRAEIEALDGLVRNDLIERYYPDLPHTRTRQGMGRRLRLWLGIGWYACRLIVRRFRRARGHGINPWHYLRKRGRAVFARPAG